MPGLRTYEANVHFVCADDCVCMCLDVWNRVRPRLRNGRVGRVTHHPLQHSSPRLASGVCVCVHMSSVSSAARNTNTCITGTTRTFNPLRYKSRSITASLLRPNPSPTGRRKRVDFSMGALGAVMAPVAAGQRHRQRQRGSHYCTVPVLPQEYIMFLGCGSGSGPLWAVSTFMYRCAPHG